MSPWAARPPADAARSLRNRYSNDSPPATRCQTESVPMKQHATDPPGLLCREMETPGYPRPPTRLRETPTPPVA